ncbi:allophanate hydrolase subunit 2-domain-containing protein [Halenospora varia]|nr:allophanate hydrolase subunit 2-domain-containing protein [Halenospora varia]
MRRNVLIANRGEIAVRCIKACAKCGIKSVSIYTESDSTSEHVSLADECVLLSGQNVNGYLNIDNILEICKEYEVDAVIPGYGFLSEDVRAAEKIEKVGMIFVGPSTESILEMGQKHRARALAEEANVPVVPGTKLLESEEDAISAATKLGFPVMLKATGGGGGMGLEVCCDSTAIKTAFAKVKGRGDSLFNNTGVFMEKYYPSSRHIEVQVFGNGVDVIHFGERECSIQRRHQKVSHPELRQKLTKCAVDYALKLKYKSAGTVEFLVDDITGDFFFLEMNTRLQVEHGITELCYNVDLVALMLQQADCEKGGQLGISSEFLLGMQKDGPTGAAIEARVYAEVPFRNFAPSPGLLQEVEWPVGEGIRIDTWVKTGQRIAPYYDPLIAKVMVHNTDRASATENMLKTLSACVLQGPATNIHYLSAVITSQDFKDGETLTNYLSTKFQYRPCAIDVLSSGAFTTAQDFPARAISGHGIPRGGPMDNISSRIANILVENEPGVETLEVTISGPELLFTAAAVFSVCGAPMQVTIDGEEKPMWSRLKIYAGQKLKIGSSKAGGCRNYIAVKGGFPDVPVYLGSKAATPSLKYGGTQGRQLQTSDYIALSEESPKWAAEATEFTLPAQCIPSFEISEVYVLHGPHDDDTFMTAADREMLYSTKWKVGHNSNRTGIRLIGPNPRWSRKDGGDGGAHPSNCFDYGYPMGGINWGGDSSVVFSMDSPNLGGLICSSTVISADLWRLGQLKPGEYVRFRPTTYVLSLELFRRVETFVADVGKFVEGGMASTTPKLQLELPPGETGAILLKTEGDGSVRPEVKYRQGGDSFIIIEFGKQTSDITITCRIRLLMEKLEALKIPEMVMNPSIIGLTIQFNSSIITQPELLKKVNELESSIEATRDVIVPVRTVCLPVVLDHPALTECLARYMATVRPTAGYLPDNVEYLRKANGLSSRREIFEILLKSRFLIVSVGFLVGNPILYPLNPMSQIMGQKFNPTRVSTPGGTVGIGGSLFSLYPVEQPGGYMMLARTLETWDTFGSKPGFSPTNPWLWEPFDMVTFKEVSVQEYDRINADFVAGRYQFEVSEDVFDLQKIYDELESAKTNPDVMRFKDGQKRGVAQELAVENEMFSKWTATLAENAAKEEERLKEIMLLNPNPVNIESPIDANVWKVEVEVGETLKKGQVVVVLEAMKMEINVLVPDEAVGSVVQAIASKPGSTVAPGNLLIVAKGL